MKITWVKREVLISEGVAAFKPAETLLDIGCGISPQNYLRANVHICCEPYKEYIEQLANKITERKDRDRSYIFLNMGWEAATKFFPDKSVDTVILVDVIEHLEKDDGRRLLALTERIAKKQLIIFTPLGFMPQHHADGKDGWGLNGASWQEHKSGWMPEDFVGEDWEFLASNDFHFIDSSGAKLPDPFGAFWAIKSYNNSDRDSAFDRERALGQLESELIKMQAELSLKYDEVNSLFLARIERKIRRVFKKITRR